MTTTIANNLYRSTIVENTIVSTLVAQQGPAGPSATAADIGNLVYVDAVHGDDGTAEIERLDLPFLTLAAAKTAAASGDTIVVRPGSYAATATLCKSGVAWYFEPGAIVTYSSATNDGALWDDSGIAVTTWRIGGEGKFICNSTGTFSSVFRPSVSGSTWYFDCQELSNIGSASANGTSIVQHRAGTVYLRCQRMVTTAAYGIWWYDGKGEYFANEIVSTAEAISVDGRNWTTSDLWVTANHITGAIANDDDVADRGWRCWINVGDMVGSTYVSGGRLYVRALRIQSEDAGEICCNIDKGFIWLDAQKFANLGGADTALFVGSGGTSYIRVHDAQDNATGFYSSVDISGGTHDIEFGKHVPSGDNNGISISGGTLTYSGWLDASAGTTKNPITKSGGTLTLTAGTTLIAAGVRNSITAGSAQTVVLRSPISINNAVHGNITLSVATITPSGVADGDKGDISVSSSGSAWTIDNDAVTYAKIQNVSATDKLLGRSTSGAGDVEEITCTAAGRALLDDANAAAQRTTLGAAASNDQTQTIVAAAFALYDSVDLTTYNLASNGGSFTFDGNAIATTDYVDTAIAALSYQPLDSDLTSWAAVTRASGFDAFTATPSSANLRSLVTDETGSSGALVFAGGPTLTGTTTVATVSFGTSTLVQGSSNVLEQRNGTNAQTQIIYGTYTDSSNYVGLSLASSSTATTISAVTAGTGADNVNITIQPAGTGSLVTGSTSSTGTRLLVSSQYLENNVIEVRSGSGYGSINASQLNASFFITASADTGIGRFVCWNQNGLEVNAYQWDDARGMGFTLTENIFNIRNPSAPGRSPYCQASFSAWSSTSPNQSLATIVNTWVDSTHASRKARTVFNTFDTAAREAIRLEASGSAAKIGFFGATAIVKPTTSSSAATFAANSSGIANDTATFDGYTIGQVVKALRDFGLLT